MLHYFVIWFVDDRLHNSRQIVQWRNQLKFPPEARITPEAKDLICRFLCDADNRLGSNGADEIKVLFHTTHYIC